MLGEERAKQVYSRKEVRRVLGISEQRLRSWEKQELVHRVDAYNFNDLIALRTLLKLGKSHVPAERIRRALAALRKTLEDVADPLVELRIASVGRRITVRVDGSTMEPISGQLLLDFDGAELSELKRMVSFPERKKLEPSRSPAESEACFQTGLELERTGAPIEDAMAAYRRALDLDPESTGALVNLGTIYFHSRNWGEAEKYYRRALEVDPNYALAHFNLGNLFDERGDREQAVACYLNSLRLDPNYADAHYNLALLYQNMGQMNAIRHWKAYLKLDATSSWSVIARQQLEKLRASTVLNGSRDG